MFQVHKISVVLCITRHRQVITGSQNGKIVDFDFEKFLNFNFFLQIFKSHGGLLDHDPGNSVARRFSRFQTDS